VVISRDLEAETLNYSKL